MCYRLRMVKTFAQLESEDVGALIRFESIDGDFIEGTLVGFGSGHGGDGDVQHYIHLYREHRFFVTEDVEVEFVGEED